MYTIHHCARTLLHIIERKWTSNKLYYKKNATISKKKQSNHPINCIKKIIEMKFYLPLIFMWKQLSPNILDQLIIIQRNKKIPRTSKPKIQKVSCLIYFIIFFYTIHTNYVLFYEITQFFINVTFKMNHKTFLSTRSGKRIWAWA